MSYVIKKDKKTKEIVAMEYEIHGYKFTPKGKRNGTLEVKSITIIEPSMIEKVLLSKFSHRYRKLMNMVYLILNSDDDETSGALTIVLDEIAKMKSLLLHKYYKFIKKEKLKELLSRLEIIEMELKKKEMEIYYKSRLIDVSKGHSR